MVLLAGLGLSGRYLAPLAAELATRHRVWVPDLPGFGRSGRPTSVLDIAALGDATVAWMDAVGMHPAVLIGNSAGCQVAVEVAVRHPDRVAGVALDAPTIDACARSVVRHVGRIVADALREPLSLWGLQAYDWTLAGPRRLVMTTRHVFAHGVEQRLSFVRCPALVLRGGRDPIVPQRWAEAVTFGLPDGRLHVDPGGTHAGPYSAPDRLAPIITEFVRAHCTAAEPGAT